MNIPNEASVSPPSPVTGRLVGNPIIGAQGVNDPHIHIFGDTAYLYASHDTALDSDGFAMADWQVWSSDDLVQWTHRSTLSPGATYLGDAPGFSEAWATDAAEKDGRYYWYFSEADRQIGVVVGDTPVGSWSDPLGHPLVAEGSTDTRAYDPGVYAEAGERYLVFGCWNYQLARLGDDMITLAEAPRELVIRGAQGPYTFAEGTPYDGRGTDDKPFLHRHRDTYYLSWGVFYATSDSLYGPYDYAGCILDDSSFTEGLEAPTWPLGPKQGRHGSFFEWHGQWYFAYCDISQTGNRYFRDTFISYVHYRDDGSIAPLRVDRLGVGHYDAGLGAIEAESFFTIDGASKRESRRSSTGFVVVADPAVEASLGFPNVSGLDGARDLVLEVLVEPSTAATIEIGLADGRSIIHAVDRDVTRRADSEGRLALEIPLAGLGALGASVDLALRWTVGEGSLAIDRLRFRGPEMGRASATSPTEAR